MSKKKKRRLYLNCLPVMVDTSALDRDFESVLAEADGRNPDSGIYPDIRLFDLRIPGQPEEMFEDTAAMGCCDYIPGLIDKLSGIVMGVRLVCVNAGAVMPVSALYPKNMKQPEWKLYPVVRVYATPSPMDAVEVRVSGGEVDIERDQVFVPDPAKDMSVFNRSTASWRVLIVDIRPDENTRHLLMSSDPATGPGALETPDPSSLPSSMTGGDLAIPDPGSHAITEAIAMAGMAVDDDRKLVPLEGSDRTDHTGIKEWHMRIPGTPIFGARDMLHRVLNESLGQDGAAELMPRTWLLQNESSWQALLDTVGPGSVFVLKNFRQRREGLVLTDSIERIRAARTQGFTIAQQYVTNQMLVKGRHLSLRFFIGLIGRHGKLSVFLHRDMKCAYASGLFNPEQPDAEGWTTPELIRSLRYTGGETMPLTLQELGREPGYEEPARFAAIELKRKLSRLVDAISNRVYMSDTNPDDMYFELLGADAVLAENGDPFIVEINKGPDTRYFDQKDKALKLGVVNDLLALADLVPPRDDNGFSLVWTWTSRQRQNSRRASG